WVIFPQTEQYRNSRFASTKEDANCSTSASGMSKTKKANLDAVFAPIPGNLLKESINLAIGSGYCILYTPASNFPNIVSIILVNIVTHVEILRFAAYSLKCARGCEP